MAKKETLWIILEMVGTAPETQLRPDYTERARALFKDEATTTDMIHKLFAEIFALTDLDASSFVRQLVNPKFTRDYS